MEVQVRMAITKIKINTSTLKRDTDSISQALNDIKKKIQAMQTDVKALNAMWTGEANEAFNQAFQDDITDLGLICDNIQSVINYEKNAKKEYDACEQKVSDLIDSITI